MNHSIFQYFRHFYIVRKPTLQQVVITSWRFPFPSSLYVSWYLFVVAGNISIIYHAFFLVMHFGCWLYLLRGYIVFKQNHFSFIVICYLFLTTSLANSGLIEVEYLPGTEICSPVCLLVESIPTTSCNAIFGKLVYVN